MLLTKSVGKQNKTNDLKKLHAMKHVWGLNTTPDFFHNLNKTTNFFQDPCGLLIVSAQLKRHNPVTEISCEH
jgi:hypothetical protein